MTEGMTLEEALEVLILFLKDEWPGPEFKLNNALKLGIEALKEIDHLHVTQVLGEDELLPGETKGE